MKLRTAVLVLALVQFSHAQTSTLDNAAPAVTAVSVDPTTSTSSKTPTTTEPDPTSPSSPVRAQPKASSSPPPTQSAPPPPPGAGSQRTAVLSVLSLTGSDIQNFNSTLGDKFAAALAQVYGISTSDIVIRQWGSNGRRILAESVAVGSAANFTTGIQAAAAVATLQSAADSGRLKMAFQAAGLEVDSLSLQSVVTAVPRNYQPVTNGRGWAGLHSWAIALITVIATVLLVTYILCCCRQCFCCCRSRDKEEEAEESLPKMIKYGSLKPQRVTQYHNTQKFTPTPATPSKPLAGA